VLTLARCTAFFVSPQVGRQSVGESQARGAWLHMLLSLRFIQRTRTSYATSRALTGMAGAPFEGILFNCEILSVSAHPLCTWCATHTLL